MTTPLTTAPRTTTPRSTGLAAAPSDTRVGSVSDPAPLVAVVGIDGSEPSWRALEAATNLLDRRPGRLEIVFVGHLPASLALSADAELVGQSALQDLERELRETVQERLGGSTLPWSFHRRDGVVAHELLAAASALHDEHDGGATVVLVVGASSSKVHQVLGSVPVALARHAVVPVFVVP